jgi:hypothetical protein
MKNQNRHSGAGRNPVNQINPRTAGQHSGFARFAEYTFCWIPAYAGMTITEVTA